MATVQMMPHENAVRQMPASMLFGTPTSRTCRSIAGGRNARPVGRGVRVAMTGGGVKPRGGVEAGGTVRVARAAGGVTARGRVTTGAGVRAIRSEGGVKARAGVTASAGVLVTATGGG